ncbi:hypothetical protein CMV14_01455 [Rhizorhabdus dicambivorans]|nr:hypothetical protein CMV14_01455 [Rhizorhabdus dicambivorans]
MLPLVQRCGALVEAGLAGGGAGAMPLPLSTGRTVMSKQTGRAGRLAAGAALMALIVGVVAAGQAAGPTAPYVAPIPPAPPVPPVAPPPPPAVAPIATVAVPPSVPAAPAPPAMPAPPPGGVAIIHKDRLSAEERAEMREAMAEAREAAREAAQAQREAMHEAAQARGEAMREAAEARREAMAAAGQARNQAFAEAARARNAAFAERARVMRDLPARIEATLAETRRQMAARCAARGVTMPAGADFGALATCGQDHRREVRAALASARSSVAGATGMTEIDRAAALEAIDRALSGLDRKPALQ